MTIIDIAINLAKAIIVLFIIVDPLGDIPIFMSLTEGMIENQKRKVFNTACLVGFVLLKSIGEKFRQHVLFRSRLMAEGTIKKLISEKGFGFIAGDGKELFFHHSAVADGSFETLREGDKVEYTEGQGPKGPRAENVKPVQ